MNARPTMDLEQYKNLSLLDMVYARIKDDILAGKYQAGERLVVSRLTEQLGVSHTPINEALNRLVVEGYVAFEPRRGMRVRGIDLTEIRETFEIRKMFEAYCADKVVETAAADPDYLNDLRQLERSIGEGGYETAVADDFQSFFARESAFHEAMVQVSGNRKMFQMYQNLKANGVFYYKMMSEGQFLSEERYHHSIAEHAAIIEAVEALDAERLRTELDSHLRHSIEYLGISSALHRLDQSQKQLEE